LIIGLYNKYGCEIKNRLKFGAILHRMKKSGKIGSIEGKDIYFIPSYNI